MANGTTLISLFQQMFEKNIVTFKPGLSKGKEQLSHFTDVRELRDRLVEAGIEMTTDLDPNGMGPASVAFSDPDGNPILIDQSFPKPGN